MSAAAVPPRSSLAYSVDADDAFMFAALELGRIDTRGLRFDHAPADTATLNGLAAAGGADVVAISLGAYPAVADRYLLLPHGASVGRGYGPVVVARQPIALVRAARQAGGHSGPGHDRLAGAAADASRSWSPS